MSDRSTTEAGLAQDLTSAFSQAASRVNTLLATAACDPLSGEGRNVVSIKGPNGKQFVLAYGTADVRRNADPLMFDSRTTECFCGLSAVHPTQKLSSASGVVFLERRAKAHQYSMMCGPEPVEEHFSDMLELASRLEADNMTTFNLHGSGASGPQHFHTQIVSLRTNNTGISQPNTLSVLLENIQAREEPFMNHGGIVAREIIFPMWGCKIEFDSQYSPREIGKVLYATIHRGLRFASQMFLSYNLYVRWGAVPGAVTILFRESLKECPFQLDEVQDLLSQTDVSVGRRARVSPNRRWRWGYYECLGGFPARDSSFADTSCGKFDYSFWESVLENASVSTQYRRPIMEELACRVRQTV